MKRRVFLFAILSACLVFLLVRIVEAQAVPRSASSIETKLPLKAVLVLTPDFCATKFKQGSFWTTGRETFAVGKLACTELEPELKAIFANLTVANTAPAPGDAQVILIPNFANAHATTSAFAFANREMDVFLEWKVKDAAGKTIWLQTVEGSSKHHMGNLFTHGHDVNLIVRDSVKDVAARSAAQIAAAPELRTLGPKKANLVK